MKAPSSLRQPRLASLLSLWLALLMAVLDGTIVNIALPGIATSLQAAPSSAIWVVNAYQFMIVIALLPLAALGQIVTFRRVFLAGLALFLLGSTGCALAHGLPDLIAARAIQGFGAAGIMSNNAALLRFIFPAEQLGKATGLNTLVIAVGAALGPCIASAILAVASWPWLFALNIPLGLLAWLLGGWALPVNPRMVHTLDLTATLLNVGLFGFILLGIDILVRSKAMMSGIASLSLGCVAGALLVVRSRRQPQPLLPIDLLRDRRFALAVGTSAASFCAQMLAFIALPFHLEGAMGHDPVETGVMLTAWPLVVAIIAPIAGRLSDRVAAMALASGGLGAFALGLLMLNMLPLSASRLSIISGLSLCGFGFGLFQAPNNRALLGSAPRDRAGAAGAMLAMARLTGQSAGATLAAALFTIMSDGAARCLQVAMIVASVAAGLSAVRKFTATTENSR